MQIRTRLLSKSKHDSDAIATLSRPDDNDPSGRPNVFNADFVRRLYAVLQRGLLSARKASGLLECDPDDLHAVCAA